MMRLKIRYGEDIRRISFPQVVSMKRLVKEIRKIFHFERAYAFSITYIDDEQDSIIISSDRELKEAMKFCKAGVLLLYVHSREKELYSSDENSDEDIPFSLDQSITSSSIPLAEREKARKREAELWKANELKLRAAEMEEMKKQLEKEKELQEKLQAEKEEIERREREKAEEQERALKARVEKLKKERERKEKAEQKAKAERERKELEERERLHRERVERLEREELERKVRAKLEKESREKAERVAKEEQERKEREEKERKEREEKERKEREEKERREREEKERKEREEKEREEKEREEKKKRDKEFPPLIYARNPSAPPPLAAPRLRAMRARNAREVILDTSDSALAKFGLGECQRIRGPGNQLGTGKQSWNQVTLTAVGVDQEKGYVWFLLDKDKSKGISFWDDVKDYDSLICKGVIPLEEKDFSVLSRGSELKEDDYLFQAVKASLQPQHLPK